MFGDARKLTLALPPLRRRPVLGTGLVGAASLALAACDVGGQAGSAPATSAQTTTAIGSPTARPVERASLRLSWIKNTEFAGFFVALDKGYYKDEGIDLTINGAAQNLSPVQAVATGADAIGLSGGASLMLARGQGFPVKAFGALFQKGPGCFVWLERSGIKDIQDFKGKRIGIQQDARTSTQAMLTMNHLKV
ncbi:MAG: ABC transporter substrate-binding protein, partial [Chloroflexota bacterium]